MLRKAIFVSVLIMVMSLSSFASDEVPYADISGETRDCFSGKEIHPAGVEIYLIDPLSSPQVPKILDEMNKHLAAGDKGLQKFWDSLGRLAAEVKRKHLNSTVANQSGHFIFNHVRQRKQLLVIGLAEREDDPAYYAYKEMGSLHQGNNRLILDFYSGKPCN